MSDEIINIDEIIIELKQDRDELYLKLKLAKLEASEELLKLEAELAKLEGKAREVGNATAEASKDIAAAAKLLGEEIRAGFTKISRHL